MQKNRAGAVPFKLRSTDASNEVLSNLEMIPNKNKHIEGKKEQSIKKQSKCCDFKSRVSSEVSKLVAGENIDKVKKILEMEIIEVRQEMILIGSAKGLNDPETVSLSQELDSLLNQYNLLK
ncbi:Spo0E family sporulation regulatory protein-aspartic acid phosphatase [Lederbergia wuyishanensis]|uniref:Aspartyl-phosphate phosphatase Spo0E family protein n=1 Tax=Lederbergia wuyishanensis TaxID=1347903 RepID=A0ABU0D249_9BACI|nr:aspartyl-phosphate phosphatase Spo0E family protein [Lederbergia wuyishanensis]MCJ8007350.1 aspartyl-phosphate phosphatase Spo0E family protein [Lederbergia wuyishanensis]MDQ0342484.1 hypothetical protein [Lederbergia wuyishanensis]